jgi:hypothetical protein
MQQQLWGSAVAALLLAAASAFGERRRRRRTRLDDVGLVPWTFVQMLALLAALVLASLALNLPQ